MNKKFLLLTAVCVALRVTAGNLPNENIARASENPAISQQEMEYAKEKTTMLLSSCKIIGEVRSTSYGHSRDGFIAWVDNDFWIVDMKNWQYATIENPSVLAQFDDAVKNKRSSVVIPEFKIRFGKRDLDAHFGEWYGDDHLLPIYITLDFDAQGNLEEYMPSSGSGAKPSHYQGYISEKRNKDLAAVFVKEAAVFVERSPGLNKYVQ